MRAASHSQTHNLLCEWIYFTCGSGVESIRRTQAITSNRCCVSHVGRALGHDSLRSHCEQPLVRTAAVHVGRLFKQVLQSAFKQPGKLLKEKLQRLWKPSCPEGWQLAARLSNRMQRLFCQRPLALTPEMKHLCEGILSWELCWLCRTKASISHNWSCCGTEVTSVSRQQRHQQTRLTTTLSVPLSTKPLFDKHDSN